jgi:GT2 family glycosyltransferase
MKVGIIFLDYLRHEHTSQALRSIANAGYQFDLFTINKKGIAAAINEGLKKTKDYDAIVTCSNDIEMPVNWLQRMVEVVSNIENTGMCGIHCVEGQGEFKHINGHAVYQNFTAFGNVMIPRKAIDTIGKFNEDYDPYGMQDADYAYRLNAMGFTNYYIAGLTSNHIGHDVGSQSEYRKMKDEGLALSDAKWDKWTKHYDTTKNYYL